MVQTEVQEQFVLQTGVEQVINGEEVVSEVTEYHESITEEEEEEEEEGLDWGRPQPVSSKRPLAK